MDSPQGIFKVHALADLAWTGAAALPARPDAVRAGAGIERFGGLRQERQGHATRHRQDGAGTARGAAIALGALALVLLVALGSFDAARPGLFTYRRPVSAP